MEPPASCECEDWELSGDGIEALYLGLRCASWENMALLRWWLGAERHKPRCAVPWSAVAQEGTGKKRGRV